MEEYSVCTHKYYGSKVIRMFDNYNSAKVEDFVGINIREYEREYFFDIDLDKVTEEEKFFLPTSYFCLRYKKSLREWCILNSFYKDQEYWKSFEELLEQKIQNQFPEKANIEEECIISKELIEEIDSQIKKKPYIKKAKRGRGNKTIPSVLLGTVKKISQGVPYKTISKELNISTATITRINRDLYEKPIEEFEKKWYKIENTKTYTKKE